MPNAPFAVSSFTLEISYDDSDFRGEPWWKAPTRYSVRDGGSSGYYISETLVQAAGIIQQISVGNPAVDRIFSSDFGLPLAIDTGFGKGISSSLKRKTCIGRSNTRNTMGRASKRRPPNEPRGCIDQPKSPTLLVFIGSF
jgi:hypothetical protein